MSILNVVHVTFFETRLIQIECVIHNFKEILLIEVGGLWFERERVCCRQLVSRYLCHINNQENNLSI